MDMTVTLHGMQCGAIDMPAGMMVPGAQGNILAPVMSYLIRHPKGDVIFDAGLGTAWNPCCAKWREHAAEGMRSDVGRLGLDVRLSDGEDLGARLEGYEVDPGSVRHMVGSHLHFDHCGGFDRLPNAELIIQRREWQSAMAEGGGYHTYKFEYDLGHGRREVDGEHDLFGDGTVVCIPTYGHTPGHQSLRVRLGDRCVVLTSDACYLRESLEKMAPPPGGGSFDANSMRANFELFRRLEQTGDLLLFGHDPKQWSLLNDDGAARPITVADIARAREIQSQEQ
jgi:glyoxylase-like metal-dependent hydrolase (beta-lactamase superfamily II)